MSEVSVEHEERRERLSAAPQIIVLAGPNGAGKSTSAAYLIPKAGGQ